MKALKYSNIIFISRNKFLKELNNLKDNEIK